MNEQHSKTPWRIGAMESGQAAIDSADGKEITGFIEPEDAHRIVACVNACAGLSTVGLEKVGDDLIKPIAGLEQQRDQLLAELEKALDSLEYVEQHLPGLAGYGVRQERIASGRAAIASVKGGAA